MSEGRLTDSEVLARRERLVRWAVEAGADERQFRRAMALAGQSTRPLYGRSSGGVWHALDASDPGFAICGARSVDGWAAVSDYEPQDERQVCYGCVQEARRA